MNKETCFICNKDIDKRGIRLHMARHNTLQIYIQKNPITSVIILWLVAEFLCAFLRSKTDSILQHVFNKFGGIVDHSIDRWQNKT